MSVFLLHTSLIVKVDNVHDLRVLQRKEYGAGLYLTNDSEESCKWARTYNKERIYEYTFLMHTEWLSKVFSYTPCSAELWFRIMYDPFILQALPNYIDILYGKVLNEESRRMLNSMYAKYGRDYWNIPEKERDTVPKELFDKEAPMLFCFKTRKSIELLSRCKFSRREVVCKEES